MRCVRCGEVTRKSDVDAGKHWCPAIERRLLSEKYKDEGGGESEVFFAGWRGKERPLTPVPRDSGRILVEKVYADCIEEYDVDASQQPYMCALRKQINQGHEEIERFDQAGWRCSFQTSEASCTFFDEGTTVRTRFSSARTVLYKAVDSSLSQVCNSECLTSEPAARTKGIDGLGTSL